MTCPARMTPRSVLTSNRPHGGTPYADGRVALVDLDTGALARLGHTAHEAADVQGRAERVEQAAVVGVGADLGPQLGLADQSRLVSEVLGQETLLCLLALEVGGAGRDPQPSDAAELAVDGLLVHEPLDGVHGLAVGVVDLAGPLQSVPADGLAHADGEAQVGHTAVAGGGTGADLALLDEGDAGALAGGVQGGGQTRQASADDHQVGVLGQRLAGSVGKRPGSFYPVGNRLHVGSLAGSFEGGAAGQHQGPGRRRCERRSDRRLTGGR